MKFRLAKKILRGRYRKPIPYTIDQIDSAYRRMRKVFRYWHRGYWDRDYWCTVEPKGYTPRLHSPIQQRILERLFEKDGGWDGLPVPEDPKALPPIPDTTQAQGTTQCDSMI